MVSLNFYWQAVQQRLPLILLVSLLTASAAYFITSSHEPSYQVHFSYLVSLQEREPAAQYRFDGYYALQATELFATTLASWTKTPEVIVAAHEVARVPLDTRNPREVIKIVKAAKTAPQLVEIVISHPDESTALKLADGLKVVMQQQIDRYHEQGIPALHFNAVATTPWVGVTSIAIQVIVAVTFIATLILGINLVLFLESLKIEP